MEGEMPSMWLRIALVHPFLQKAFFIKPLLTHDREGYDEAGLKEGGPMEQMVIKLTVRDKILLLLLNYTKFRGELQVPVDLTQEGIASNLGIIRSAVPRAVGSLISRGEAEEYLAHVDNLSRRRKVYLLTDSGILAARSLLDSLNTLKIEVIDSGSKRTDNLEKLLSSNLVSLKNISDIVLTRTLDRSAVKGPGGERRRRTSYTHSLTPPDMFLDREVESEEISKFLSSSKKRVLVIYGIAGVGKTTLSWKVTQLFGNKMDIFYIDLKEWTTLGYVIRELSGFLASTGDDRLSSFSDPRADLDIDQVCDLLKTLPQEAPLLFIFDDLHRAPQEVTDFLGCLKERLPFMKGSHVMVLSRTRATFYDIRDVRLKGLVGEMELLGFDRETSRKFLLERGFDAKEVDSVIERTGGHPLALVLVEKEGLDIDMEDFDHFLKQEIFSKLPPDRLRLLGLLSLCRLQLGETELSFMLGRGSDAIPSLMDGHLVFGTTGGYMVHDLIKDQAVQALDPDVKESCHRDLARLFHERLTGMGFHQEIGMDVPPYPFGLEDEPGLGPVPLFVSEEIYHQLGSGEELEAMDVLIKAALQIPSMDLVREFGPALVGAKRGDKDPANKERKDFIRMLLNIADGNYGKALITARKVCKYRAADDDTLIGSMRACCGLWLPHLIDKELGPEEGLKAMEAIDEDVVPERMRYYLLVTKASLMYKVGDHKGASVAYSEFLNAITGNEDLPVQLKDILNDIVSKTNRGSIKEATDQFHRIMALTSANRDILREEMPYVDIDHHLLSAIYSLHYVKRAC